MEAVNSCCVQLTGKQSFKEPASGGWQNWFWQGHWTAFNHVIWQARLERFQLVL